MTIEIGILFLVYTVLAVAPTYIAVIISYRLNGRMLSALERFGRTQSMIISELIAYKTLKDTQNEMLANQQLTHSNAYDARMGMNAQPWTPPMGDEEEVIIPKAANISPEIVFGDDGESPPFPGEDEL